MLTKPDTLFNRDREWEDLDRFVSAPEPRLKVGLVYGRRRFGKSFLLRRLVEARSGLYHLALEEEPTPALRRFAASVASLVSPPPPLTFAGWDEALTYVLDVLGKGDEPQVLVIDEYPYLRNRSPELDSVLQSLVDASRDGEIGAAWNTTVSVILCGSAMSVMADLLSGTAPLRGRAILDLCLDPFDYRQARGYWGISDEEVAFRVDAVVGGAPGHKDLTRNVGVPQDSPGFESWLFSTVMNPSHALYREDQFLLREDPRITKRSLYYSLLNAMAGGFTSQHQISANIGKRSTDIQHHLEVLMTAGFVNREDDLLLARSPVFRVADPIVRFHELITRRHQALLEDRKPEEVWRLAGDTFRSQIIGPHFEAICRTWTARYAATETLGGEVGPVRALQVNDRASKIGFEVDVVAATAETSSGKRKTLQVLGEAKGMASPCGVGELERLDRASVLLGEKSGVRLAPTLKKLLFALRGFEPELVMVASRRPDVELVDLQRLYHGC